MKTVELNAPFYSWPTSAAVQPWVRRMERRKFVFTVKASELITHVKRFNRTKTLVRDFGQCRPAWGSNGMLSLPTSTKLDYSRARLNRILIQLDPSRRNVVEFGILAGGENGCLPRFARPGVIFSSCSGPRLPDELVKSADNVYIRFHGAKRWYWHAYTREEARGIGRDNSSGESRSRVGLFQQRP